MTKVALFGAAGAIGKSIAAALSQHNMPYRVVGRSLERLEQNFAEDTNAELMTWNPDQPDSIIQAATGVDTLVYMVGVDYWHFNLHPLLMRKTLDAAIQAGVKNIVLIGTVYPYGMPTTQPVAESHAKVPCSFKGKMRQQQEAILLDAHAKGLINATILRLPDFYGPGVDKSYLYSAIQAGVSGQTADLIGPIDAPHEFLYAPDVGEVVRKLAMTKAAYGRDWNLAGCRTTSQAELIAIIEQQTGQPLKRRVAGKFALRLLGLFDRFLREVVEMHYLLTNPIIMDDSALEELIGPIAKTSYEEGIAKSLAFEKEKSNHFLQ